MPRPNRGYYLKFHAPRNSYYVFWYVESRPRKRSANTTSLAEAEIYMGRLMRECPLGITSTAREGGHVYFVAPDDGPVKIGHSVDMSQRMMALQTGSPVRLSLLASVEASPQVERDYHQRFAAHRLHGEWFARHPDILAEIERLNMALISERDFA